jgi:hypothetical protein
MQLVYIHFAISKAWQWNTKMQGKQICVLNIDIVSISLIG